MKKLILISILIGNFALLAFQLALTTQRAGDGEKLASLEKELTHLTRENREIANQVYSLSSIERIHAKAQELQLVPAKSAYLTPPPVAAALATP